jgi:hypothetical protein
MSYRGTESATWRRWNEVLADQQKQKVDERSRAAELAARRADEKEEERARFAAGNTGAAPVSSWAGRKLKVIVKVRAMNGTCHTPSDFYCRLRTIYSSPGRTIPGRGISRAWYALPRMNI